MIKICPDCQSAAMNELFVLGEPLGTYVYQCPLCRRIEKIIDDPYRDWQFCLWEDTQGRYIPPGAQGRKNKNWKKPPKRDYWKDFNEV